MMVDLKNDIDSIVNAFKALGTDTTYEKICEWSPEEKEQYEKLLEKFEETNSNIECSTSEKGDSLENIATFVLKSGNIFKIINNVRTTTNELDQVVIAQNNTCILMSNNIIDPRLKNFIGECKNYDGSVSVTYVGKLCSLLVTTGYKIGVLFSYNGVSGKGWSDASGLIKKFYLSKEKSEERFCIIDFNIDDFRSLKEGKNFLQIISDKIKSLELDTGYKSFISKHEAEDQLVVTE